MKRLLGLLALATLGCGFLPAENPKPDVPTVEVGPLVEGNTRFALDLYAQVRNEKGNLFLSPYSISSALSMTYLGASGDTAAEMKKTLALPADDKLHAAFHTLNAQMNGDPKAKRGYQLAVANRLWGQAGYPWEKEFLATTHKYYDAGLEPVDFRGATEQARKTINAWVEKQTQDKIKELLVPGVLTGDTRLVLTNAIYFKGDWASQFKKDNTREQPFKLDASTTKPVPMMFQQSRFGYAETADTQILRMAYAGKELELVVVLPRKVDGLEAVEKSLTPELLQRLIASAREQKVNVTLPKFKMESQFSLKKTLEKMGMPLAFDEDKANFTGLASKEQLYISAVIHKTFVEVNEVGTEAAGATAVVIARPTSAIIETIPNFRADHPFLFLIRDTRNGSILFLGRFSDPG